MAPGFFTRATLSSTSSTSSGPDDRFTSLPSRHLKHMQSTPSMSSSASTYATATRNPNRGGFISDRRIADVAADGEATVQWNEILRNHEDQTQRWKWLDNAGHFSLYSRQESQRYAVLAAGVLPCSVPEIVRLLHTTDPEKFLLGMEALYGEDFKDGAYVHRVNLRRLHNEDGDEDEVPVISEDLMDVSVKSVVFSKSGWLNHHEKWNYVDASYRRQGGKVFEKISTTLPPKDGASPQTSHRRKLFSSSSFGSSRSGHSGSSTRTRHFHNVTTAFSVRPEENEPAHTSLASKAPEGSRPWRETRVLFYAEYAPPSRYGFAMPSLTRSSSGSSSDKAIKERLLVMARSCERLTELVRRRRLGVQILVDRNRLSFFMTKSKKCVCCHKSIVLLGAKQCRICGQGVCTDCSSKHERETQLRGSKRMLLEDVRVCDRCMDRVDRSDFSHLNDDSLLGPSVMPNPPNALPAAAVLKELLKDELLNADSSSRKASVMNVIKCVLDQEDSKGLQLMPLVPPSPSGSTKSWASSTHRRGGGILLTPAKTMHEADFVDALEKLEVKQVPFNQAQLSTTDGRSYAVNPGNPDEQMEFPMPENEAERLKAMEEMRVKELINNSDELNIICELAAKEMDTFASMVTIVTPGEQQVVASNVMDLQNAKFARSEAFCSHTIMDDKPLVIPHPEADVRFHQAGPVKDLGIRYYCGFPIKTQDDTVIGALCCINKESKEMTETQFNAMQKLAQTASKVIQVQGKQRRQRTGSTVSSTSTN